MQGLEGKTREEFFNLPMEERYRYGDAYNAATRVVIGVTNVDGTSHGITKREPDSVNKAFEPTTGISRDFGGWADIWRHAILEMADVLSLGYFIDGEPNEDDAELDADTIEDAFPEYLIYCLERMVERDYADQHADIEQAYVKVREDAIQAIEEQKPAIERVANALLKQGDLTGEQVHELIEQ